MPTPIAWPIVGVISRATGRSAKDTYKIYKGHEQVDAWQFHVFDLGEQLQQPRNPMTGGSAPTSLGPGFGGKGAMGGISGGGPQPGMWGGGANRREMMYPNQRGGTGPPGWKGGFPGGKGQPGQQYPGMQTPWLPGQVPGQPAQGGNDQGNP